MPTTNSSPSPSSPSSPSLTCTRRLHFCAGHRVMGHENKCAHLHGHNYTIYATAAAIPHADPTDPQGRVIDFSVIKERLDDFIQTNWDHGFILYEQDERALAAISAFDEDPNRGTPRFQHTYKLPYNPTAENIAKYLLTTVCPALFEDTFIEITRIIVEETENCKATATLSPIPPSPLV